MSQKTTIENGRSSVPMDKIVMRNHAYSVSEDFVKEYESGRLRFVDDTGTILKLKYLGRGGNHFNATFVVA